MKSFSFSLFKSSKSAAEGGEPVGKVDTVAAKRRKCDSCSELHSRTFELPCSHLFCKDCTRGLFESALNDKAYMPVKCCGKRVDQRLRREVLHLDECFAFETILEEVEAPRQMYCPRKDCSTFHNLDKVVIDASGTFSCKKCGALLCSRCRVCHPSVTCAQYQSLPQHERTKEDLEFYEVATRSHYARCGKCARFVEKMSGCDHVQCNCGNAFNYSQKRFAGLQVGYFTSVPAPAPVVATPYMKEEIEPCVHSWETCNSVLDRPRLCHFCQKTKRCFQNTCSKCHLRVCSLCKVNL